MDDTKLTKHPAKYSKSILALLSGMLPQDELILDPFAGVGTLAHHLAGCPLWTNGTRLVNNEIEWEWASQCPRGTTVLGNALYLPFANGSIGWVVTSPVYGSRLSDSHDAKDGSYRVSYTHTLGRKLHPLNSGQLQWGVDYKAFHVLAWRQVYRVLRPGGMFVLNISDHIRKGQVVPVSAWHKMAIEYIGFKFVSNMQVQTPRMRRGRNYEKRVAYENVYIFER